MTSGPSIDGVLVEWGERLFYPSNRIVKTPPPARLETSMQRRAAEIRGRIVATVSRRAPQVMVKVTGGGRGMSAIAAHFRYISKNGRMEMEDERGVVSRDKEGMHDLLDQWRYGGSLIDEVGHRREAFNIMLSMPKGTDPSIVQRAARDFAKAELWGHSYVMVLHDHQANPHVHLSIRAESMSGKRLNPRKADLHRWRETFAERLRGHGIEAEATRQATRGANRVTEPLWKLKAREEGRVRGGQRPARSGDTYLTHRVQALQAWAKIAQALDQSDRPEDRKLAQGIARFIDDSAFVRERGRGPTRKDQALDHQTLERRPPERVLTPGGRTRPEPDWEMGR